MKPRRRHWPKLLMALAAGASILYWGFPAALFSAFLRVERWSAGLSPASRPVGPHRMAYLWGGTGDTVLFVHGFGGSKDHWLRLSRSLTPHYTVIAVDLPGFGDSDYRPEMPYSIRAQVAYLAAFADSAGLGRFHLAASSMGAHIAGLLAIEQPSRIQSLAFFGGCHGLRPVEPGDDDSLRLARRRQFRMETTDDLLTMLDYVLEKRPWIPAPVLDVLAKRARDREPRLQAILPQISAEAYLLEDLLEKLVSPLLVIWGDKDRVIPLSRAATLQAKLPKAELCRLEGVGHGPMVEAPEACAALYLDFLKRYKGR